jgi:uncharacterized protein YjiS (DUF1127 family)
MSNFLTLSRPHKAAHPSFLARSLDRLADRISRFRAVNELEQLSDRQLRDIGVDRPLIEQVARREIEKLRSR